VGRALQRALGTGFVLPEVEPREGGTSLLMNPRRQRVFEYVWNYPCSHLRRISRELGIPPQSLRWHLLRLRESGLLASAEAKGKTVYYAPWAIRAEDVTLFATLSNGAHGKIVRFVAERKETTQSEIFRGLKTYQQAVLPPLGELTRLGLLRTWKENGKRFYVLGDAHARLQGNYAAASHERLDRLLAVLKRDGVSPKVQSRGDDEVQVQVSSGVQKSVLRLRLAPAMR
jgi:DNA-binding transcriptional ArsR family regulator